MKSECDFELAMQRESSVKLYQQEMDSFDRDYQFLVFVSPVGNSSYFDLSCIDLEMLFKI